MSRKLWKDHPATPRQQRLVFTASGAGDGDNHRKKKPGRVTQADVLLAMLRQRRQQGKALELPEILAAGIAQFTARIYELRRRGFVIENELEHVNGQVHSRYWLRYDPEVEA